MKESYLDGFSLFLVKKDKVIFKSKKEGLKPLIECIKQIKLKEKDYVLHDKVVGLAAAKLIVYSGVISEVVTPLCSDLAKDLLIQNKIKIKAEEIVENILNEDKTGICPMELKAIESKNCSEFFDYIQNL